MNYLAHALNAWHEHGGALRIVRSTHWGMPHAQHEAQDGTITHYVPHRDLAKPLQSLWGFAGEVRTGDDPIDAAADSRDCARRADPRGGRARVGDGQADQEGVAWLIQCR